MYMVTNWTLATDKEAKVFSLEKFPKYADINIVMRYNISGGVE